MKRILLAVNKTKCKSFDVEKMLLDKKKKYLFQLKVLQGCTCYG